LNLADLASGWAEAHESDIAPRTGSC